jgi:cytochrome c oxidase assembly protein subunit 11
VRRSTGKRRRHGHVRHAVLLACLAAGMFGFAYALVPLYEIVCELVGVNGRTTSAPVAAAPEATPAEDRMVTVQFLAHVNKGMPWEFRPTEKELRVRIGEVYTTHYYARNRSSRPVRGQAVPSVAPSPAAPHLKKVECFCFTEQRLDAGADMEMPVLFFIEPDLPQDVRTMSLSYSLFRLPDPDTPPASHEQHIHEGPHEHGYEHGHEQEHETP